MPMITALAQDEDRCPYLRGIRAGDEIYYMCDLVDKWCLREGGLECEEYDLWLKEREEED